MSTYDILDELETRLPELEWKLRLYLNGIPKTSLPRGLFQTKDMQATPIINEIKSDIEILKQYEQTNIGFYLAQKIRRKIYVLVNLCFEKDAQQESIPKINFLNRLQGRQQLIQAMQNHLMKLVEQKNALLLRLNRKNVTNIQLALNKELGAIEKEITMTTEEIKKLMGE